MTLGDEDEVNFIFERLDQKKSPEKKLFVWELMLFDLNPV